MIHMTPIISNKRWKLADRRNDASPFPVIFTESGCGENSPMFKALGVACKGYLSVFEGPVWTYYEIEGDLKRVGQELIQKVQNDPFFVEKSIEETYKWGKKLLELTDEISTTNLTTKSNQELWNYYEEYVKRIKSMRGYAWIAPALDMGELFTNLLQETLQKHLQKMGKENEMSSYFTILTNPSKISVSKLEGIDNLKIALEIKKKESLVELFKQDQATILKQLPQFLHIYERLQEHNKKYRWLPCNYEGEEWDLTHFILDLSTIIKSNLKPEEEIERIKNEQQKIEEERINTITELHLPPAESHLFKTASEILFFKSNRKDIFFQSYHEMRPLLQEIGRRLSLNMREVRFLLPGEIKAALLEGKVDRENMKERLQYCITISENDSTYLISGAAAKDYMTENVIVEEIQFNIGELKGTCAYPGLVKGMAKIILSPRDIDKMNQGDILISPATNPDIITAMKKAAAIVTNTGGITCHAAIVSRELKIPCVVGTKIATEVLKDGDLIEVDANHGSVRKLEGENSNNIKLIIFDFSGVCFNEEEPPFLIDFAKKHKLPFKEFELMYLDLLKKAEMDQISGEEIWKPILKKYNLQLDIDQIINEMIDRKVMYQEVMDLAKSLRHKYKTSYFTNYNKKYWEIISPRFDLKPYFDWGIVSYQVKSRKPAIEGFKVILEHFKVKPEEAIFLDDKESNLIEPAKLGLNTILFKNKKQFMEELKRLGVEVE